MGNMQKRLGQFIVFLISFIKIFGFIYFFII
jgi:preprotein translocase subunit YajC